MEELTLLTLNVSVHVCEIAYLKVYNETYYDLDFFSSYRTNAEIKYAIAYATIFLFLSLGLVK